MVTQTQSYLCGSAPVQKAQSKPPVQNRGERSQGGPAMGCREEARRRHFEGLPFGLNDVRVPALVAKHVSRSPPRFLERLMRLLFPAIRVPQAITWRKWRFIITDEVSRRLHPQGGVRPAYKVRPKGLADAPEWRRCSRPPPPQRWPQNGSSSSRLGGVKRETTERVDMCPRPKGQLALQVQAAKWPGWSSSSQPGPSPLRNILFPPRERGPGTHSPSQNALGKHHGQPAKQ